VPKMGSNKRACSASWASGVLDLKSCGIKKSVCGVPGHACDLLPGGAAEELHRQMIAREATSQRSHGQTSSLLQDRTSTMQYSIF
jgi:hypothetical protein